MKVANTNCLDDLIDKALLLLFLLLDCRICIKRRCNSQTCCACVHAAIHYLHTACMAPWLLEEGSNHIWGHSFSTNRSPTISSSIQSTTRRGELYCTLEGRGQKNFHPKNFHQKNFKKKFKKKFSPKKFSPKKFQKQKFQQKKFQKKNSKKNFHPKNFQKKI